MEYWKRQEVDLSCRWETKNVSVVRTSRREFKPEKVVIDEGTGEKLGVFPATKRMQRQLLQIPFALLAAIALGAIIATCFAIEIFISELYNGPLKTYLVCMHRRLVVFMLTFASLDFHSNHSCISACAHHECHPDLNRNKAQ